MDSQYTIPGGTIEAINGGHLHWSDFRENVLKPFRINFVPSPMANDFPKSFLVQLEAAQKNISKHDIQRQAWRGEVAADRGLNSLAVFPPNLVPCEIGSGQILRCMLPRMSREGLPLRLPHTKNSLYELPTARPIFVFGFDIDGFPKSEQAHLTGALSATGVSVDYVKGEVHPSKTLCCPFLAFEKSAANNQRQIETARNSCAITGAQCLRGQQQLFHKAFGSQIDSQPLITFTCALNNEHAVINYHNIGEDGDYNMAALCKFDLEHDDHFNTFQAWIEAISTWATSCLLPRIQGALSQVVHSHPTPPPSPSPTHGGLLSIDTKSSDILSVLHELRRICPSKIWRSDSITAETPINSSMAICGTPLPTREIRSLSLPRPSSSGSETSSDEVQEPRSGVSKPPKIFSDVLSPLRTDLPSSAVSRHRSVAQYRLMMSPGARTPFSPSMDPGTPISPCRPPSLSPCTPGPDMPMSSMNPILVLQRRLGVAVTEIQELRIHVDELQEQLNSRTASLEQKLKSVCEKQENFEKSTRRYIDSLHLSCQEKWTHPQDNITEQDMKTPTSHDPFSKRLHGLLPATQDTFSLTSKEMPGHYKLNDDEDDLILWSWPQTEQFLTWCIAVTLKVNNYILQLIFLISLAVVVRYDNTSQSSWDLFANLIFTICADENFKVVVPRWGTYIGLMVHAAIELQSDLEAKKSEGDSAHGDGEDGDIGKTFTSCVCEDGKVSVGHNMMDRSVQVDDT